MNPDDTIDKLNDLIEICKDGEYGFRSCAEQVKSPDLKSLLGARAAECATAARDLQAQVTALGGKPDDSGSATGAMHRGWVAVKGTLTGHDDLAILEECERGEDRALAAYREAIKAELGEPARSLVDSQYQGAKRNHDQIRDMRNRLRAEKG